MILSNRSRAVMKLVPLGSPGRGESVGTTPVPIESLQLKLEMASELVILVW